MRRKMMQGRWFPLFSLLVALALDAAAGGGSDEPAAATTTTVVDAGDDGTDDHAKRPGRSRL